MRWPRRTGSRFLHRMSRRRATRAALHHIGHPAPQSGAGGPVDLSAVPGGELVQIRAVRGGHCVLSRLACLGFTPGARLRVIQNFGHGPMLVALRDTRVALGRGEASKILVERVAGGNDVG